MRIVATAVRGYSVLNDGVSFLCLQIQEKGGRITLFQIASEDLSKLLYYIDEWMSKVGDPNDIDEANIQLEKFRNACEALPSVSSREAACYQIIDASRFGEAGRFLFFDVIFLGGMKREYLFDIVTIQGFASVIEDHLSISRFLG